MRTIGVDIRVLGTGRISGIEEYAESVISHMTGLAGDIRWKLFYSGGKPLGRRGWMDRPGVSVHEISQSNRLLWLTTRMTGRPQLDALVGGADAFFFPHFILGAVSQRCRRVMTWHDLSYERMSYLLSPYRRFWHAVQMRPRQQAQMSDRIIAVSSATAADLVELYQVPQRRVAVVPSGIDATLRRASDPAIGQWRVQRGIDRPFVLAMGTREPRKNLPALITAWDALRKLPVLRNVQLVLAGQRGWMEGDIRHAIASVHAPQDIRIFEDISREERPLLLSAASVLAYPSLMEGFGFPPLEAMACGTPVVAGANSSLIETVGDAGLLIDPYRVDSITTALTAVLTDAGLRSRLIARGYERAAGYSWERTAEATLNEILSVL